MNGVRSGKLFANLGDAECTTGSGTYCEWKVNDVDVYYQWETGPNSYNQFAAVKDANGAFVTFEAPLQLNFHVPAAWRTVSTQPRTSFCSTAASATCGASRGFAFRTSPTKR